MRGRHRTCRYDSLLGMLLPINDLVYEASRSALTRLLRGLGHHTRRRSDLGTWLPELERVFVVKRLQVNLLFVGKASFLAYAAGCTRFISN